MFCVVVSDFFFVFHHPTTTNQRALVLNHQLMHLHVTPAIYSLRLALIKVNIDDSFNDCGIDLDLCSYLSVVRRLSNCRSARAPS